MTDLDKALDHVFSLWIRSRNDWRCLSCPRAFNPPKEMVEFPSGARLDNGLECSHFWGKGLGSFWTRWHDDCADSLCISCHRIWEKMKAPSESYYRYKRDKLGDHVFAFMSWLSTRTDPMHEQVKEFRLYQLIAIVGSRGYPTRWLFNKYGNLIRELPPVEDPEHILEILEEN